jgi:hypothetical protein
MIKRVIDTTIAALFGAFVLIFCIVALSASFCEQEKEQKSSVTTNTSVEVRCKPFNIVGLQSVGSTIARHPNETASALTAVATAFIAWFTFTLKRSTDKLSEAGERQLAIANRALMATHRPKIGIRRLELNMVWESDQPAEAKFILVNRGASTAYIERANGILYFRSPNSGHGFRYAFDDYQGAIEDCPAKLEAGEFKEVKIRSVDTKDTADRRLNGKWFIYAAGLIIYKDETETRRTTAFLREFKSGIEWTFLPVNDPEYEYED